MPVSAHALPRGLSTAAAWPARRWLVALGVPFGLAFALLTPPLQTPDELAHLARALAVSEGAFGAEVVDGRPSIRVPQSFAALPARLGRGLQLHAERRQDPRRIARELARPQALEPRAWRPLPSLYSPLVYVPQAAGVALARGLGLPVVAFVYAGRLANLAVFLAATWLALRLLPAHATTLALVALLPMTLFLAGSLAADAPTNALAFLWLGLVLRAAAAGAPLRPFEGAALAAAAAALGLAKSGYAVLAAMALAVPAARFASASRRAAWLAAWAAAALVPGLLWSAYVASLEPPALVPGADPGAQARWIAEHPAGFAAVVLDTLAAARGLWGATFVGVLGHADTWLPRWIYVLYPLVLLAAALVDGGKASPLRGARRALALAAAAAAALSMLTLAYVGWNAVGSSRIQGVQGRYFTPLAPLALAALHAPRAAGIEPRARLAFVAFAALALAVAVGRLFARYYGPPS